MDTVSQEALELYYALGKLHRRGRQLLQGEVSMEAANHFHELVDIYLGNVGANAPSMESIETPNERVSATMEGLFGVIKSLINLFKSNREVIKKTASTVSKVVDEVYDIGKITERFLANREWVNSAPMREVDSIHVSERAGAYFYRGGKAIADPVGEFRKDIAEYKRIFTNAKAPSYKFARWGSETFRLCEKSPTAEGIDQVLTQQLPKRPPYPATVVKVDKHDRLGFPAPDTLTDSYDNEDTIQIWEGRPIPERRSVDIKTATREQVPQLVAMIEELYKFADESLSFEGDLWNDNSRGGFDDPPFRVPENWNAVHKHGLDATTFDAHAYFDLVSNIFVVLYERAMLMAEALFLYVRNSFENHAFQE